MVTGIAVLEVLLNAQNFCSLRLFAQSAYTSGALDKVQLLYQMHSRSHLMMSGLHSESLYMITSVCGGNDSCCGVMSYYTVQS